MPGVVEGAGVVLGGEVPSVLSEDELPLVPPMVPLLPLVLSEPLPGVPDGVFELPGVVLELPASEPPGVVGVLPIVPPAAPGLSVLLLPVPGELGGVLEDVAGGGVLGEVVDPDMLEPPVVVSLVPGSFLLHAVNARAASRAVSKIECFMSDPLIKICL